MSTTLIVGLGNPGSQYDGSRHNIGFAVVDELAARMGVSFGKSKWQALTAKGQVHSRKVQLVKPQTYMNLSGEAVAPLADYFAIDPESILVVHDDLDLGCGQVKLAFKRGHGGHNGLKSIHNRLGTNAYNRLRFGIGRPPGPMPVERFVLGRFQADEQAVVDQGMDLALEAIELFLVQGLAAAMQEIHSR